MTAQPRVEILDPFPGRVPWPCGRRPYRRTLRAWHYRTRYWYPRLGMWLYVVLPPVVFAAASLPLEWSTAARMGGELTVLAVAVVLATFLDFLLYAPMFHGRAGSPGIADAAAVAAEWRRAWLAFEAQTGELPSVLLSLHEVHEPPVPNFDGGAAFATPDRRRAFERGVREGFARLHITPLFGVGATHDYPALLVVWPLPEPARVNGTVWLVAHLLNNAENDSCRIGSGYTYWWSPGLIPGVGWYRGDEATLKYTLPLAAIFSPAGFLQVVLIAVAVLLWPIGILVLVIRAIIEAVTHQRFAEFLRTADPRFGDSLDLALITKTAQENTALGGKPDAVTTERLRLAAHHFHKIIADALLAGASQGVR